MDWTELLRDTWRVMRRTPALWGLGTVSALQAGMYGLIVVGLIAPMTALTQVLVQLQTAPSSLGANSQSLQEMLPGAIAWIQRWEPVLLGGIVASLIVWAVLGVLDVAATGGAVSQTVAAVEGRQATVGAGMRDGFRLWWRVVGLLAIAALPILLYLLVVALFTLFTISIPLRMGVAPDVGAIRSGDTFNGLLSSVVGLIGVPLGVLVTLGIRFAVVDGQEWRAAFASAWRLAKANFSNVALMYLLQLGVGIGATTVMSIAIAVVLAIAGIIVALLVGAAHSLSGAAMFVTIIAVLLALLLVLVYSIGIIVWVSVVWTLFWRRITGRDIRPAPRMYAAAVHGYPSTEAGGAHASPQGPPPMTPAEQAMHGSPPV